MIIQRSLFLLISLFAVSQAAWSAEETKIGEVEETQLGYAATPNPNRWKWTSSGKYCTERYKSYRNGNCKQACIDDGERCGAYTEYRNGWCQLVAPGCSKWESADDTSSITWQKDAEFWHYQKRDFEEAWSAEETQIGEVEETQLGYAATSQKNAVTEEKAVGSGWTSINSGNYCTTRYKSYKDTNCEQACIADGAACGSYTKYLKGWCQLIAPGCSSWNSADDTSATTWTRCPSADLRDRSGVQKRNVLGEDQIGTCSRCARGDTDISNGIVFNWVDGKNRKLVLTDKYGNWVLDGQLPVSDSSYRNTDDWDRSDWKGSTHGYDVEKFIGCADRTCEHATTVQGGAMWTSCSSNPSCPSGYWPDGPSYDAAPSMWEAKYGKFGFNCVLGRKRKCQNSKCHRWGPSSTSSGLNTLAESSINVYSYMRQGSFYMLATIGLFATIAFLWKAFNKTATYTEVLEADV